MILTLLHEAWVSIKASRLRMFLAVLGIVIGVASVVLMLAIGTGSRRMIEDTIASLGTNMLIITPGSHSEKGLRSNSVSHIDMEDALAVAQLPSVAATAPGSGVKMFQVSNGKQNWHTQISGTTPDYFTISNWEFIEGGPFTGDDVRELKRVAVIGSFLAEKLFPGEMAQEKGIVGRSFQINGVPFIITGLLKGKGAGLNGDNQDDVAFVPITSARSRLWGGLGNIVQVIFVEAISADAMDGARADIVALLRQRHRLREVAGNDFTIKTLSSLTQVANDTAQALSTLLGAIASISLLVGGIGVMNIMLVTVSERTREIGIRKALGSTETQILLQFLLEAVLIAYIGSLLGLLIAFAGGWAVEKWFFIPVEFSLWSVVLALGVAGGVGIGSGLYPAYKAAKLQPIEALRVPGG